MNVRKALKKRAKEDLKALETDSDREFLQRLKKDKFGVPINDYLFQVLINENVVSEFVYVSAPTMKEARKRFAEKMREECKPGEWCMISVYRKIS